VCYVLVQRRKTRKKGAEKKTESLLWIINLMHCETPLLRLSTSLRVFCFFFPSLSCLFEKVINCICCCSICFQALTIQVKSFNGWKCLRVKGMSKMLAGMSLIITNYFILSTRMFEYSVQGIPGDNKEVGNS
jgi:hypothetical protein